MLHDGRVQLNYFNSNIHKGSHLFVGDIPCPRQLEKVVVGKNRIFHLKRCPLLASVRYHSVSNFPRKWVCCGIV